LEKLNLALSGTIYIHLEISNYCAEKIVE